MLSLAIKVASSSLTLRSSSEDADSAAFGTCGITGIGSKII